MVGNKCNVSRVFDKTTFELNDKNIGKNPASYALGLFLLRLSDLAYFLLPDLCAL